MDHLFGFEGCRTYAVDQAGTFTPAAPGADIGMLHLPLSARLRSVDGQHRRRGLKDAIDQQNWVGGDHTGILIYVEPEVEKRKQMFSDMNWTARQVSKSVNVGFNSRDPFAKVVNIIVESHPLLAGRTEAEKAWITKGTNHLFTLGAIYEALRRLELGPDGRMPKNATVDEVEVLAKEREFFDLLQDARTEFQRVLDEPDSTEEERKSTILLNGTVLKVIAGAVSLALKDGYSIEELTEPLRAVDFSPEARIWLEAGFIAPGKTTPGSRNQEVRAAVMALVGAIAPKKCEEGGGCRRLILVIDASTADAAARSGVRPGALAGEGCRVASSWADRTQACFSLGVVAFDASQACHRISLLAELRDPARAYG